MNDVTDHSAAEARSMPSHKATIRGLSIIAGLIIIAAIVHFAATFAMQDQLLDGWIEGRNDASVLEGDRDRAEELGPQYVLIAGIFGGLAALAAIIALAIEKSRTGVARVLIIVAAMLLVICGVQAMVAGNPPIAIMVTAALCVVVAMSSIFLLLRRAPS